MLTRQERVADLLERAERLAAASAKESEIATILSQCDQTGPAALVLERAKALYEGARSHLAAAKAMYEGQA